MTVQKKKKKKKKKKEMSVLLACYLYHATLRQLVVYSECNVNANILFNKETKQLHVCQMQEQKKINQCNTE